MPELLPFLRHLSAIAREVTLGAAVPGADNKAGEGGYDPVTELDRGAERALRAAIEAAFPEDGIEGEEYGLVRPRSAAALAARSGGRHPRADLRPAELDDVGGAARGW